MGKHGIKKNYAESFLGSVLDGFAIQMSGIMDETGISDEAKILIKEMVMKIRNVHKIRVSITPTISRQSFNIEYHKGPSEMVGDTNLKKRIVKTNRRRICGGSCSWS